MLAVIALPALAAGDRRRIDRLRRRFDPRHAAVPAHVTLAFPKAAVDRAAARQRVARAAAATPGIVRGRLGRAETIRTPGPRGWFVVLPVTAGAPALARLHHRLSRPPLDGNRRGAGPYRPHLTVAARLDRAAAGRVRRMAQGWPAIPLSVGAIRLAAWDGRTLETVDGRRLG
ncbi:hypothetical protein STVA_08040 [Allostella vacuolata]|nr:hypothetical protein STVA_08040 [Stella vacuolata]